MSNRLELLNDLKVCKSKAFNVLVPISTLFGLVGVVLLARKRRNRKFPDNLSLISSATMTGVFLCTCIPVVFNFTDNLTGDDTRGFYSFLCYVQAFGYQLFRTAFIWNWILSMIVIYIIIVQKTPVRTVRTYAQRYYCTIAFIAAIATIIPAIRGAYGQIPFTGFCWNRDAPAWRLALGYSHLAIGITLFMIFAIPVVKELYSRSKEGTADGGILLKDLMYQQVFQAFYLCVMFSFAFLSTINGVLVETWSGAFDSTYVLNTTYTYCVGTGLLLPLTGIAITLILLIPYSKVKSFVMNTKNKLKSKLHRTKPPEETFVPLTDETYRSLETPREGTADIVGAESIVITVVSFPPGSEQQRTLERANAAYTMALLLNVKEELMDDGMDESEIDSFCTEQSELTTENETEEEFNDRLQHAKERWLKDHNP